jgi:phage baseplate assembly protein gpV
VAVATGTINTVFDSHSLSRKGPQQMSLNVVDKKLHDRGGVITVQGNGQEEVMSAAAKQLAINTASTNGIARPGVSGNEVALPGGRERQYVR